MNRFSPYITNFDIFSLSPVSLFASDIFFCNSDPTTNGPSSSPDCLLLLVMLKFVLKNALSLACNKSVFVTFRFCNSSSVAKFIFVAFINNTAGIFFVIGL